MRKIFASILVLVVALVCFSAVAFAADTDVYFGAEGITAVTATEDTYTVEIYYNPTSHACEFDGEYYMDSFSVDTTVTNGTNVTSAATIENWSSDTTNSKIVFSTSGDSYVTSGAFKVADITITRADGAATSVVTLSGATASDFEGSYAPSGATLTITWPSAKVPFALSDSINTNATIKGAEKTYTGVWVGTYTVVPNDDVITGITINGEVINKTLAEGEGQVVFKIAAIPAPAVAPTVTVNVAQ